MRCARAHPVEGAFVRERPATAVTQQTADAAVQQTVVAQETAVAVSQQVAAAQAIAIAQLLNGDGRPSNQAMVERCDHDEAVGAQRRIEAEDI